MAVKKVETAKPEASSKEVAPAVASVPALVSDQLPAYLHGSKVANGSDNFDNSDVIIPRIKLLQGISPEIEAFDNARAGDFWHSGMDISLGNRITFIVADRRKKYLLSAPLEDGQGVLARSDDAVTWDRVGAWQVKQKGVKNPVTWEIKDLNVANSGLADWGTYNPADEDSPPAATLFYDYLVFLPEYLELGPAVISLARSNIRQAKKGLNDKIKLHQTNNRPMQALVFSAESFEDSADGQTFKNWRFKSAGFVQDKALFDMATEHAGALRNVKIADEGYVEQASPEADGADDGRF